MNDGRCLAEHAVVPPRQVEVLAGGRWWPGVQRGWRMYDDGTGWRAAVTYVIEDDVGVEAHDMDVPVENLRVVR